MTKSILALTLALGMSAGLAGLAHADQTAVAPSPSATAQQEQATQSAAISAYNRNVNPQATVHSTGIYDQEDLYRDANGSPLPGDTAVFGESGMDNN